METGVVAQPVRVTGTSKEVAVSLSTGSPPSSVLVAVRLAPSLDQGASRRFIRPLQCCMAEPKPALWQRRVRLKPGASSPWFSHKTWKELRWRMTCVLSLFIAAVPCEAAELSSRSRVEIDTLLNRLGESGCQFNRNGTLYTATEAKAHLVVKLNYLLEQKLVGNTEQFIELAASKSSTSRKHYLVVCQGTQPVPSATWLNAELQKLRVKRPPAKPPMNSRMEDQDGPREPRR